MIKLGDFGISKVLDGTIDMAKTVRDRVAAYVDRGVSGHRVAAGDRHAVLHEPRAVREPGATLPCRASVHWSVCSLAFPGVRCDPP